MKAMSAARRSRGYRDGAAKPYFAPVPVTRPGPPTVMMLAIQQPAQSIPAKYEHVKTVKRCVKQKAQRGGVEN